MLCKSLRYANFHFFFSPDLRELQDLRIKPISDDTKGSSIKTSTPKAEDKIPKVSHDLFYSDFMIWSHPASLGTVLLYLDC